MNPGALPVPSVAGSVDWVAEHLADLTLERDRSAIRRGGHVGGTAAARAALDAFDVTGYADRRSEVWPPERRGASRLSPYVRHGLVTLPALWEMVADAPSRDRAKFRDELLWQEYARHLYARAGTATASALRFDERTPREPTAHPWSGDLECVRRAVAELHDDGWLVNQTRMWLASHWTIRHGADWRAGDDHFFRHLLDGSRAANRVGWQWTTGRLTGRVYGFTRRQVERRAPGWCASCPRQRSCPIEDPPPDAQLAPVPQNPAGTDPGDDDIAGPGVAVTHGSPDVVWLTAESLGADDPALAAHPDLPAVFVFDRDLLGRLRLSAKRLVFLAECLADLAERRRVEVHLGDPVEVLAGRRVATTFTPVPGGRARRRRVEVAALHPWPWLRRPVGGRVTSFSAWRRALDQASSSR